MSSGMQRHEGSSAVLPDVSQVLTATIIGAISSTSHLGSKHLWNVGQLLWDYTAEHFRTDKFNVEDVH
jgi:hypothetical protein